MSGAHDHAGEIQHVCPTCQQPVRRARIDVIDVAGAVEADKLTEAIPGPSRRTST